MTELFLQYAGDVPDKYAFKEDGRLTEYGPAQNDGTAPGAIFCGRAGDCVKAQEAAFIILGRNGKETRRGYLKTDKYCPGDRLPVQIIAPADGEKPPRLTDNITLSGRFAVLKLSGRLQDFKVDISKKISGAERRAAVCAYGEKLSGIYSWYRSPESDPGIYVNGLIMRTACEDAAEDEILNDACKLKNMLDRIRAAYADHVKNGSEGLLYAPDAEERFENDYPGIKIIRGDEGLFERERIDREYARLSGRKVLLPSGGNIIIDRTEALTAIDVNSASASARTREELILNTNLEAAEEIARQLRLRKITGIVLCDLINMNSDADKSTILHKFRTLFSQDPAKTEAFGFTKLGLLEISRKRSVIS